MNKTTKFDNVTIENDIYQICLSYIGEGYNGDYNPADETDEPLMRCDVYNKLCENEYVPSELVASMCTGYSIRESHEDIVNYANKILTAITTNTDKNIGYVIDQVIF